MKKILILLFISLSLNGFAQQDRERIHSMRIAYITQQLALTPTEAEKFWPVYNVFTSTMQEHRREEKMALQDIEHSTTTMSETEAEKKLSRLLDLEEQKITHRRNLVTKLNGVIPATKIIKLFKAEDDFKRKLLMQYGTRRGKR